MSLAEFIKSRGVQEVVHFTTNHGCLGTLASKALKSRQRLNKDDLLEYIFQPNSEYRKDSAFLDYVNLSFTHINAEFFERCSRWHSHKDVFWCILSFEPSILLDPGVIFTTTNNIYTGVQRAAGEKGMEAAFSARVTRWAGNVVERPNGLADAHSTCEQAEVLYPGQISSEKLRRIYVRNSAAQSEVAGFVKALFHPKIELIVAPEKFDRRPTS